MQMIHAKDWKSALAKEFEQLYFKELTLFLQKEKAAGKIIFPMFDNIFKAFELTPLDKVKVVLLGQDPYHGDGQAQGLSFSVPSGIKIPPSLRNIFNELRTDLHIEPPMSGDLTAWAKQGVLLLNNTLTVAKGLAGSHSKCGWQSFTDAVIKLISEQRSNVVFILWGNFAHKKEVLIDEDKHCVLKSSHPSPLGAYKGFFGSKPFSSSNNFLISKGKIPINWNL